MNKKFTLLGILTILLLSLGHIELAFAQSRSVSGRVVDESGQPIVGTTLVVTGTNKAMVSGAEGRFLIADIPASATQLHVSFVGYKPQVITIPQIGFVDRIIKLEPDNLVMEEVVVTALGVSRSQKALGYSAQSVNKNVLKNVTSISPLNALSGAVAGMNVNSSGGGPGSSVRILIRGANSLSGSNEPLYVVDGVPIDNTFKMSGDANGGLDFGNASNNINPDDIADITVLKGGAAAALYGSRGQNGVIMITTKTAEKGGALSISVKQSVSMDSPMLLPSLQNDYSQGASGKYVPGSYLSWGEKMSGQKITNFLGQEQTLFSNDENPFKEFFSTGYTSNTSLSVNKGTKNGGIYFSTSYLASKGTNRTDSFNKLNLNLRVVEALTPWLKMDVKVNVLNQVGENRPRHFGSPDNPIYALYYQPRSVLSGQLTDYITQAGEPVHYTGQYQMVGGHPQLTKPLTYGAAPLVNNPYWAVNLNNNKDERNRLISYARFDVDLTKIFKNIKLDKFEIMGRAGLDTYYTKYFSKVHDKTLYKPSGLATISQERDQVSELNLDFLVTIQKQWSKFGFSFMGGGNLRKTGYNNMVSSSDQGIIDATGHYVLNNFNGVKTTEAISRKEVQSVYATATFDYASQIYLDVSARNDWSSALAPQNWSFFYPSISASWLLSETFRNTAFGGFFDMLKLRGSYAQVGADIGANQLQYLYVTLPGEYMGLPYGTLGVTNKPNYWILPENTISAEVGISAVMFKNRLTFDAAYYMSGTKNQIFAAPVAPSTGFNKAMINSGFIRNKGVELSLRGTPVSTKNTKWDIYANFSYNHAKVEELSSNVDVLTLGGMGGVAIQARLGQTPGMIEGTAYARDERGNIVLDEKNLPTRKLNAQGAVSTTEALGQSMPKYLGGLGTSLSWKGLSVDLFFDMNGGGKIYSYTNAIGRSNGVLDGTQAGRDQWEMAKVAAEKVGGGYDPRNIGGLAVQGSKDGVVGTYYANPEEYHNRLREINEASVYDATFLRFQRASIGYDFGGMRLRKAGIKNLLVSIYANNICYLYKDTPNITPKMTSTFGSYGGVEYYAYPELRNIGMSISITF